MIFSIIFSIIVVLLISKNISYLGNKLRLVDKPTKNKIHKTSVSLLGGPIIFLVLLIFLIPQYKELNLYYHQLICLLIFFTLGLIDDMVNLNSNYKILIVLFFSLILINFDESFLIHKIFFEISNNEYYFGKLKIPVTLFCILLLYIAMNMSDGINCLLISFSILALLLTNIFIFNLSLNTIDFAIMFSLIILFYLNYKNLIFLGNSGASLLASYFIYKLINVNYFNQIDVFEVISVFFIMGLDMVRLVISRLVRNKNPFERDLNHFHHLLLKKMNLELTIIFYLILSLAPILLAQITGLSVLIFMSISIMIYLFSVNKLY